MTTWHVDDFNQKSTTRMTKRSELLPKTRVGSIISTNIDIMAHITKAMGMNVVTF